MYVIGVFTHAFLCKQLNGRCLVEYHKIVQPRPPHVGERCKDQLPSADIQVADVWLGIL